MNVLDALLFGIRNVLFAGSAMPTRSAINVHGAGVTVTDDVANERTDIEIPGAGPGAGLTLTAVKTAYYEAAVGELVLVDATAGDITIVAPTNAAGHTDERWGVLRVEPTLPVNHVVTMNADDGINDEGTRALAIARSCCILRSDGATWRVESEFLDVTVSDATPTGVSTSGSAGTSTALARGDHVHALTYAVVQSAIGGASSALGLNAQRITGVADPVSDQDAATKAWVLANAGGASWRVTPDAHDLGVWTMSESSGAFANTGSAGALDLTPSGLVSLDYARQGPLVTCASFRGTNYAVGPNATGLCEPASALTVWAWVLLTSHVSGLGPVFAAKLHDTPPTWSAPYEDWAIWGADSGSPDRAWYVGVNIGGSLVSLTLGVDGYGVADRAALTLGVPHLVGLTHDGTTLRAYLDGALVGSTAASGSIGWGDGPIVRGGNPSYSGHGGNLYLGEMRISDVARDAAYFAEVYQSFMRRWP